ncbi:MAG: hypothetical protein WDO24_13950 [Pseudomonadota bacterium]
MRSYPLTADQLAAWKKTVEPLQKAWTESVTKAGANADQAMSELKASLATYGAGF